MDRVCPYAKCSEYHADSYRLFFASSPQRICIRSVRFFREFANEGFRSCQAVEPTDRRLQISTADPASYQKWLAWPCASSFGKRGVALGKYRDDDSLSGQDISIAGDRPNSCIRASGFVQARYSSPLPESADRRCHKCLHFLPLHSTVQIVDWSEISIVHVFSFTTPI